MFPEEKVTLTLFTASFTDVKGCMVPWQKDVLADFITSVVGLH